MPVDRKLNMAVKPVDYHFDYTSKCTWEQLPGKEWWLASHKGRVFAEVWIGKSGVYGLLYTVKKDGTHTAKVFRDKSLRAVELTVVGALFNGRT